MLYFRCLNEFFNLIVYVQSRKPKRCIFIFVTCQRTVFIPRVDIVSRASIYLKHFCFTVIISVNIGFIWTIQLIFSCFKLHIQSCIISSFRTVLTTHNIIKQTYHYETTLARCVYFQTSYKTVKLAHCTRNANNLLLRNCFYSKQYVRIHHTCFNMYQLASNWTNFSLCPFVFKRVATA